MDYRSSSVRMGEAVARALLNWRARGKGESGEVISPTPSTEPHFTIAISRQAGTRGSEIARLVGQRLGWPVYDRELIHRISEEMGLRSQLVESVDERSPDWLTDGLSALFAPHFVPEDAYVHHLSEILVTLSKLGNCVIVGRGAAKILPRETTLRVRLVGPFSKRVAAMQKRLGLTREEAEKRVKEIDYNRNRFVRDYFHKDPEDSSSYDLVLNSIRLTSEDCAALIVEALKCLRKASTPNPLAAHV